MITQDDVQFYLDKGYSIHSHSGDYTTYWLSKNGLNLKLVEDDNNIYASFESQLLTYCICLHLEKFMHKHPKFDIFERQMFYYQNKLKKD